MTSYGPAWVEADDVAIAYDGVRAVASASFTVHRGEKFVIIGPSGCGKTTLLKALAGFISPTGGSLLFRGRPIVEPGPERAVVFQDFNQLFPWHTVLGNVVYALRVAKRIPRRRATERASKMLELVGIAHAAERFPHQLSGGMKQRAAIARALAMEPEILLMDEPFGSLDAITRSQLQLELDAIWRETGVTIILVTHSIQEAVLLGHRVMVMSGAPCVVREIVETASADEVESQRFAELSNHLRSLLITPGRLVQTAGACAAE